MGVLIPVGYGNCTFHFSQSGVIKHQSFSVGYNWDGSPDPSGNAAAISGFFTAATRPFIAGSMITDFTYLGTTTTEVDESGPLLGSFSASVTGTRTGGALPPNTSLLISKGTALGGRKNRGRIFLPTVHFDESLVSGAGILESTGLALFQGYWTNALTAWVASSIKPVLLHSAAGLPTPITALTLSNLVATQRRRLR